MIEALIIITSLILCWQLASILTDLMFGKREKVKFMPPPPPMVTTEDLKIWAEHKPELLERYLRDLKPMWVSER